MTGVQTCALPIFWGENDPIFTVANGFFLRNNIRGSQLKVVPGAGHVPQLSHAELVEGWVRDFQLQVATNATHRENHEKP